MVDFSNGTWRSLVDGTEYSAIPDQEDLHARYDATELSLNDGDSVTTWTDETDNGNDLTAGTAPTFKTGQINGNPVVRFDGVDDTLDVVFNALSQPNTIYFVAEEQSISGEQNAISSDNSNNRHIFRYDRNAAGEYNMYAGGNFISGGSIGSPSIQGGLFDGASSALRQDGTQVASGDVGSESMDGLTVGSNSGPNFFAQIDIGEILIYPQDKSSIFSDIEQYLAAKWGIDTGNENGGSGSWTTLTTKPTPVRGTTVLEYNGDLYTFGGYDFSANDVLEIYGVSVDSWSTGTTLPDTRYDHSGDIIDGTMYIVGGEDGDVTRKTTWGYDPATDSWDTSLADMPEIRRDGEAVAVNGILYYFGGDDGDPNGGNTVDTVYAYDPGTDSWSTETTMPGGQRRDMGVAAVNGIIYVYGGVDSSDPETRQNLARHEAYDPATDSWDTSVADMPNPIRDFGNVAFDGQVYALNGRDAEDTQVRLQTGYRYDPASDTWTEISDAPTARSQNSACTYNGSLYNIAGWDGNNHLGTNERFDL